MNERKLAGANYIIIFFNDVQSLTSIYSQYKSYLSELEYKYGTKPEKWESGERDTLNQLNQNIKFLAHKVNVQLSSICKAGNITEKGEVENKYKVLNDKTNYILKIKDVEEFVIEINTFLANEIIKDLLRSSQDTYNQIYETGNSN